MLCCFRKCFFFRISFFEMTVIGIHKLPWMIALVHFFGKLCSDNIFPAVRKTMKFFITTSYLRVICQCRNCCYFLSTGEKRILIQTISKLKTIDGEKRCSRELLLVEDFPDRSLRRFFAGEVRFNARWMDRIYIIPHRSFWPLYCACTNQSCCSGENCAKLFHAGTGHLCWKDDYGRNKGTK